MNQPTGYPKSFWVLTRAEVIVEDCREVINHEVDQMVGGTFDALVAEKMAAVLKENQSIVTMIKSEVQPLPSNILNAILPSNDINNDTNNEAINSLLALVDM